MNKIKSIIVTALALSVFTFTGCKTVDGKSQPDIARIARVTQEATTIGTLELLRMHPEWKAQFQIAHDELARLEQSDTISISSVLDIVNRLPVKELKSDKAQLAVTGARLLISAIDVPQVSADQLAQIRPIVTALRQGLEAAGVE